MVSASIAKRQQSNKVWTSERSSRPLVTLLVSGPRYGWICAASRTSRTEQPVMHIARYRRRSRNAKRRLPSTPSKRSRNPLPRVLHARWIEKNLHLQQLVGRGMRNGVCAAVRNLLVCFLHGSNRRTVPRYRNPNPGYSDCFLRKNTRSSRPRV